MRKHTVAMFAMLAVSGALLLGAWGFSAEWWVFILIGALLAIAWGFLGSEMERRYDIDVKRATEESK